MTRAPANLLAVRSLLLAHLDDAPGADDLQPAEVGIVGDAAHIGEGNSYHLGLPEQSATGYAATESPRDKAGLCEFASALDVGDFEVTTPKGTFGLQHFSRWCVAECVAGAPDTRDIREIIYSPDGRTVKRWDRLAKRSTGDDSHLWHTHLSYFRDSTKAGRDQTPLFRRYLTTIGLLEAPDMTPAEMLAAQIPNPITGKPATFATFVQSINTGVYQARQEQQAATAAILGAVKGLDTDAILAEIRTVAAAEQQRDADLAELVRQGLAGELTAQQVLVKLRDLLPVDNTQQG